LLLAVRSGSASKQFCNPAGAPLEVNTNPAALRLAAGEKAQVSSGGMKISPSQNLEDVLSRRQRRLTFRDARLADVAVVARFTPVLMPHRTRVQMTAGRVSGGPEVARSPEFHQGQQIELPDNSDAAPRPHATLSAPDLSRLTAWREGRLEFRGESLVQAVEEFGRYHREQFKFADNALRKRRVGGIAYTSSLNEFLVMLRIEFNIQSQISIEPDGTPIITLASGTPKKAR
jgi:ferric-dicitrate binding protein FerR (iron transport regulator)